MAAAHQLTSISHEHLPTSGSTTIAAVMSRAGHSVDVAANGCEAPAFLECEVRDAVVSDLKMPVLDGAGE